MFYKWSNDDLHLFLQVQPKARKDEFAEISEDSHHQMRIKLRITAPPVDGKANKHLMYYLSRVFKVPKSHIVIKSGKTGRNKHLVIQHPRQLPELIKKV